MALLRQCLLELRAAQELAQSRKPRRALGGPSAFGHSPWPLDMPQRKPQSLHASEGRAATRIPSIHSH